MGGKLYIFFLLLFTYALPQPLHAAPPVWEEIAATINQRGNFRCVVVDPDLLSQDPRWQERLEWIQAELGKESDRLPILDGLTLHMKYTNPVSGIETPVSLRFPSRWVAGTPVIVLLGDARQYPPEAYPGAAWIVNLPISNSDATTLRDYHRIRGECLAAFPQITTGRAVLVGAGEAATAALKMADRHPERFSAVAFSGAASQATLPHLDEKVIVHFAAGEDSIDLMSGRTWIQHLHAQGNLRAYTVDGGVVDAISLILDLDTQELLPLRGAES